MNNDQRRQIITALEKIRKWTKDAMPTTALSIHSMSPDSINMYKRHIWEIVIGPRASGQMGLAVRWSELVDATYDEVQDD